MHRTLGDGYITDIDGKNLYADEDPPTRLATQLRHQEMNALQEEVANVIEATGGTLNPDNETPIQANQLDIAIDAKDQLVYQQVTSETDAKFLNLASSAITNDSSTPGTTEKDALNYLYNLSINPLPNTGIESLSSFGLSTRIETGNAEPTQIMSGSDLSCMVGFKNMVSGKIYSVLVWTTRKILTDDGTAFSPLTNFLNMGGCFINLLSKSIASGFFLNIYAVAVGNENTYPPITTLIAIPADELFNDNHRDAILTASGLSLTRSDVMATYISYAEIVERSAQPGVFCLQPFRTIRDKYRIINTLTDPSNQSYYILTASLPSALYGSPGSFSLLSSNQKIKYIFPPCNLYYINVSVRFKFFVFIEAPALNFIGHMKFLSRDEWQRFSHYPGRSANDHFIEEITMYKPSNTMQYCTDNSPNNYGVLRFEPIESILHEFGRAY